MKKDRTKLAFMAIQNILTGDKKAPVRALRDIKSICENELSVIFHEQRVDGKGRRKGVPNRTD